MVVPLSSKRGRRRCSRVGVYLAVAREGPESGDEQRAGDDKAR